METRHTIRALDPLIVGKIAAGEVVERPAFAIKELIENCIDAGATAITVEIRDGGLTYFRVTDNGCGIARSDIRLAFARHATSKLRRAEDLSAIHTLGFRGEALASIAAVARVEMTTRAAMSDGGVKAIVNGGVIEAIQDAASPEGTSITVRDLFFNVPARRKFLKKPQTEAGLVSDIVMRLILSRPDISFRLHSAERQVYHSPGNGSLSDALFSVIGREALGALVEVKGSAAGCAVYGFIGIGEAARSTRGMQSFILNGRFVRNAFLSQALEEGCRELVMTGKHPICALHLTMPFEAVDVNVHPNKLEVRFQDERMLMEGLAGIVRTAFAVRPLAAAPSLSLPDNAQSKASTESQKEDGVRIQTQRLSPVTPPDMPGMGRAIKLSDSAVPPAMPARASGTMPMMQITPQVALEVGGLRPSESQQQISIADEALAELTVRVIGVAWLEYVLCEQSETLYIIDQHAAHERILYEKYLRALDQNTASQQLLVPKVVQLTHREHAALLASLDDLAAAGFEMEDFGDRTVQVRAVPMVLGVPQLKPFLGDLADCLAEYKALPVLEKRREMLVKLACRKAVKAGDALPLAQIELLIAQMQGTSAPPTCPHGRPIIVRIEKTELDKRFRRIV